MNQRINDDHLDNFVSNTEEVHRLVEIHSDVSGKTRGRKYDVEVLNKSAIVLLVACWEAFVEDLAEAAFTQMLQLADDHRAFSARVLTRASRTLRESTDARDVWKLAGTGWQAILANHKQHVLDSYTGRLNTPRPEQINRVFAELLGITRISKDWKWTNMKEATATKRLEDLVSLRGSIAHRVSTTDYVRKAMVSGHLEFVGRLAIATHNSVNKHLKSQLGSEVWHYYEYG